VKQLDELPIPDFSDYFSAISNEEWSVRANLVAESSRGCWWGAKAHCTFCGLNGSNMAFRSKSAQKFADELAALRACYHRDKFLLSDNIMDLKYLSTLLPYLVGQGTPYDLFYETKSNLRKEQLELMAAAGVRHIQPGIESFSSAVLGLMRKGTTKLQNVQLLRWCKELRIGVSWSLLYGFPGEDLAEYEALASIIPSLVHLPAPTGHWQIRLDRFSPYWNSPQSFGLRNVKQTGGYDFIYLPLIGSERMRLAYFFDYEYCDERKPRDYFAIAAAELDKWELAAKRMAILEIGWNGRTPFVRDSRRSTVWIDRDLLGPEYALLKLLDVRTNVVKATDLLKSRFNMTSSAVEDILDMFRAESWILEEGGSAVSLVVDPSEEQRVIKRLVNAELFKYGLSNAALSDESQIGEEVILPS
jgi:ribosomal peptide maturation radical SAM protein 1